MFAPLSIVYSIHCTHDLSFEEWIRERSARRTRVSPTSPRNTREMFHDKGPLRGLPTRQHACLVMTWGLTPDRQTLRRSVVFLRRITSQPLGTYSPFPLFTCRREARRETQRVSGKTLGAHLDKSSSARASPSLTNRETKPLGASCAPVRVPEARPLPEHVIRAWD